MTFVASSSWSSQVDWKCPTCRLATRARAGLYALPNNPLIVAAVQAICAGGPSAAEVDGGWRRDKAGAPIFEFWSGSGGHIYASIEGADAWADVVSYSALTLDCAIALLAGLAADPFRPQTSAPRRDHVWLGAPAVLTAKGYRRFGAERAAFADMVDAEIAKIQRLRFRLVNYPAFDPATRKWSRAGISRGGLSLFEAAGSDREPDPCDCARGTPLRFGAWCENWLNAGGAMWVSPFPQLILQLDHRDNRGADALAKKIATLLALNWGATRNSKEVCMEVRTLLRRTGELRRPGRGGTVHPGRLADRLEEALLRLSEAGILKSITHSELALSRRAASQRWCEDWLESVIAFSRPDFIGAAEAFAKARRGEKNG
jgi:hypothetical protein